MKKLILICYIFSIMSFTALAIQEDQTPKADATEATTTEDQEPPASSKIKLVALTAVGIVFLGLAFRNSKFGRKKR
ncbi:MAG: hypothetical protein JXR03_17705 [Cyclobacteriaceae bacterium]